MRQAAISVYQSGIGCQPFHTPQVMLKLFADAGRTKLSAEAPTKRLSPEGTALC